MFVQIDVEYVRLVSAEDMPRVIRACACAIAA